MDNTEIIQEIRERFEKHISKDPRLSKLQQQIENGTAAMVDADIYASRIAECYNLALHETLGKVGIEEYREAIDAVLPKGFHQITDRVNDRTREIIDLQLKNAGIGMKAVPSDYDYRKEKDVIREIQRVSQSVEEVSQVEPTASRQIESFSQKVATNTIQTNAKAQNDAGLEVRVTRIYDGIGVHNRKERCSWCLERCGEDMPYREAYANGTFERHPGCHCEIFYKPKKGGWQRQSNWRSNAWEESQDPKTLRMRQIYGVREEELERIKRKAFSEGKHFADTLDYRKEHKLPYSRIDDATGYYAPDGSFYKVDGRTVFLNHSDAEKADAQLLVDTLGGKIVMIPEVKSPQWIRTPDYTYNGKTLDRKAPTGSSKRTIKNNILKAKGQSTWVLLNITDCKLAEEEINVQIDRSLYSTDCNFVEALIVIKDGKILKMLERI